MILFSHEIVPNMQRNREIIPPKTENNLYMDKTFRLIIYSVFKIYTRRLSEVLYFLKDLIQNAKKLYYIIYNI